MAGIVQAANDSVSVIELTQTGCQFLEPEGIDHEFKTRRARDCETINKKTSKKRLKAAKPLELKAGEYRFRVFNKNVPYELGFWLRGTGFGRVTLPSTSGGGIKTGQYQDYTITLKAGEYVYSCPLNPTPDYPLIVR